MNSRHLYKFQTASGATFYATDRGVRIDWLETSWLSDEQRRSLETLTGALTGLEWNTASEKRKRAGILVRRLGTYTEFETDQVPAKRVHEALMLLLEGDTSKTDALAEQLFDRLPVLSLDSLRRGTDLIYRTERDVVVRIYSRPKIGPYSVLVADSGRRDCDCKHDVLALVAEVTA